MAQCAFGQSTDRSVPTPTFSKSGRAPEFQSVPLSAFSKSGRAPESVPPTEFQSVPLSAFSKSDFSRCHSPHFLSPVGHPSQCHPPESVPANVFFPISAFGAVRSCVRSVPPSAFGATLCVRCHPLRSVPPSAHFFLAPTSVLVPRSMPPSYSAGHAKIPLLRRHGAWQRCQSPVGERRHSRGRSRSISPCRRRKRRKDRMDEAYTCPMAGQQRLPWLATTRWTRSADQPFNCSRRERRKLESMAWYGRSVPDTAPQLEQAPGPTR